jgi:EF hand domain-containing protein
VKRRSIAPIASGLATIILSIACANASADPPPPLAPPAAVTPKLLRYAERIVRQHDANGNGHLEADEWRTLRGKPELADENHDGRITVEEMARYVAGYGAGRAIRLSTSGGGPLAQDGTSEGAARGADSDATSRADRQPRRETKFVTALPAGVPKWFVERDADGDGQLTLAEFSPKLLKSEIDEFQRHDANRDGIVTIREYLRPAKDAAASAAAGETVPRANP